MARRTKISARIAFAGNLKQLRLARGLSQEGLAELSGLHRTYVGSVERGERNISIDNMERLAEALQTPLVELLEQRPLPAGRG
ncbi:MAG TPA: helix-turn-helix transcriptional regulator [Gammaproteobacteria bacterium]|nr:helix-turn-helix transcriptional regulator [Gammaproteobacteria bacterium]